MNCAAESWKPDQGDEEMKWQTCRKSGIGRGMLADGDAPAAAWECSAFIPTAWMGRRQGYCTKLNRPITVGGLCRRKLPWSLVHQHWSWGHRKVLPSF